MDDAFERKRRIARRRMAQCAFGIICAQVVTIWAVILFHPYRQAVGEALTTVWPALAAVRMVLASIVIGYLGVSVIERIFVK